MPWLGRGTLGPGLDARFADSVWSSAIVPSPPAIAASLTSDLLERSIPCSTDRLAASAPLPMACSSLCR